MQSGSLYDSATMVKPGQRDGRLTSTYDANSNPLTKQDARSIKTTYAYDARRFESSDEPDVHERSAKHGRSVLQVRRTDAVRSIATHATRGYGRAWRQRLLRQLQYYLSERAEVLSFCLP